MTSSGLVPVAEVITDEKLAAWASTFLEIAGVSAQLARTPFVPVSLRVVEDGVYDEQTTAANVAAAILTGREIGMEPMAALRSMNVINATPALSALALRALALRNGHHIWLTEATNTRAIVAGLRAQEDESRTQQITWTLDDAKARNLAGKPNWRAQPRNMLIARATSEVVRLVAADAILGIPYSIEEIEDGDLFDGTAPTESPPPPAARTARRRGGRPAAAAAVPPAPAAAAQEEPPPAPSPITDDQRKALQAGFKDLGIRRDERLRIGAELVGRKLTTFNDLGAAEASKILDEVALRKARRDAARPPEDEPSLDDEPPPPADEPLDEVPPDAPATGEDFVVIRELFDRAKFPGGREGQDARVRYASNIVDRKLAGPKDLTHAEAEKVKAALRIVADDMDPREERGV